MKNHDTNASLKGILFSGNTIPKSTLTEFFLSHRYVQSVARDLGKFNWFRKSFTVQGDNSAVFVS